MAEPVSIISLDEVDQIIIPKMVSLPKRSYSVIRMDFLALRFITSAMLTLCKTSFLCLRDRMWHERAAYKPLLLLKEMNKSQQNQISRSFLRVCEGSINAFYTEEHDPIRRVPGLLSHPCAAFHPFYSVLSNVVDELSMVPVSMIRPNRLHNDIHLWWCPTAMQFWKMVLYVLLLRSLERVCR